MKRFIIQYQYSLFAILGTIIVLWQLLLPGYVLTLDWVSGPHVVFSYRTLSDLVSAPTIGIIYLLESIFPVWIVQKMVLIGLVFSLFYIPLRFYPFVRTYGVAYVASIFFAINPYVYERLLAGQWRVVMGYVFLWPVVHYMIRFVTMRKDRDVYMVTMWMIICGTFSVHGLAIAIVMVVTLVIMGLMYMISVRAWRDAWSIVRIIGLGAVLFIVISGYWIVPYMMRDVNTLADFDGAHWQAFATATDPYAGVVGNVATLRGFWGEDHVWADQFIMPDVVPFVFYGSFVVIFGLCVIGMRALYRDPAYRSTAIMCGVMGVMSIIFASGISAYGIWVINQWLFDHVSVWSGFRDTQKWTGVTALTYALVCSVGVREITMHAGRTYARYIVVCCSMFMMASAPMMLGGLWGQLHPVFYPSSWYVANAIIADDPVCKALFLPWHQYYGLSFAHDILTANPSQRFFSCDVIAGRNTELGDVRAIAGDIPGYDVIEAAVTSNRVDADSVASVIATLRAHDVRYVIVSRQEVNAEKIFTYPFLRSQELRPIYIYDDLVVFEIINDL